MKVTEVVCGALVRDGKVLIARRLGAVSGGWYEFPGGKVETGETPEEALAREWQEEMGLSIENIEFLAEGEDVQPDGRIHLTCFTCTAQGQPEMRVHDDLVWTEPENIYNWKFFESDRGLVRALEKRLHEADR